MHTFASSFNATVYPGDRIVTEIDGFRLTATIHRDDTHRYPWEDCDGHGPVSDWTTRDKRPGERVLASDRSSKRYYDVQGATAIAKRDEWGPRLPHRTAGQARAAAVEADYQFLKGWCDDEWMYVGVSVTVSRNGTMLTGKYDHALWGIESIAGDYCTEVANDYVAEALENASQTLKDLVA